MICQDYDPSSLPKGGANKGIVVPFKMPCPPSCVCGGIKVHQWFHTQCNSPYFLTEQGDLICKNHLTTCKPSFVKDEAYKCNISNVELRFEQLYLFLISLASVLQFKHIELSQSDTTQFSLKLFENLEKRWT